MFKKINVLVVDDSAFMRKVISDILERDSRIKVIGTARNGEDALRKRQQLRPDVITLDVEMPVMDGLETLKKLMESEPCPVVMVSSTTKKGTTNTLLAMEYGAVDFVTKPSGAISLNMDQVEDEIIKKILQAAKVTVFQAQPKKEIAYVPQKQVALPKSNKRKLIAIGTSTGGPRALKEVITNIKRDLNAPILIVQHMPAHFTHSLAERLDSLSDIRVKEAEHDEKIENGTAYIAPGGYHLGVVEKNQALYTRIHSEEPRRGHRPAVDLLYEDLAKLQAVETVAVIMTGMGADGSEGLIQLKKQPGCYAIAEAEQSCVVYGMPKAAVRTNLVDEVVHLDNIANRLNSFC